MTNRHKKLERKRLKRKERLLQLKKSPLDLREQHVGKTPEEKSEYLKSITSQNILQSTNIISEKKNEQENIEMIGEKKEEPREKTSETISGIKETFDEDEQNKKKKKSTWWTHLVNRWKRKWADGLIDGFFSIGASVIVLIIGYFFVTNDVKELREELNDSQSKLRKSLENNIANKIQENLVQTKTTEVKEPPKAVPVIQKISTTTISTPTTTLLKNN